MGLVHIPTGLFVYIKPTESPEPAISSGPRLETRYNKQESQPVVVQLGKCCKKASIGYPWNVKGMHEPTYICQYLNTSDKSWFARVQYGCPHRQHCRYHLSYITSPRFHSWTEIEIEKCPSATRLRQVRIKRTSLDIIRYPKQGAGEGRFWLGADRFGNISWRLVSLAWMAPLRTRAGDCATEVH